MSSAQDWADRIQEVIRAAEADGFEVLVEDEDCDCKRIEIRVSGSADDALIMEWNA